MSGNESSVSEQPRVVCSGCGKAVSSDGVYPGDECHDCGGRYVEATPDRLACDRCGDDDASRVFNSPHNRLCDDCIEWENSWRVKMKWGKNTPHSGAGYRTVRVQAETREEAIEKAKEEVSFVRRFSRITALPPRSWRYQDTESQQGGDTK